MTEQKRADIAAYWKETAKDKNALQRTCELFDVTEDEVKEIIQKKRKAPFWNEERVTRLKAYLAQGMKNTEIANQLGCNPQVISDYKKNHKEELASFIPEKIKKSVTAPTVTDRKENAVTANDSISKDDITTSETKCQEVEEENLCTITAEEYDKLYTSWTETYKQSKKRLNNLVDVSVLLTAAEYIADHPSEDESAEREYGHCYKTLVKAALELANRSIFTAERE